MGKRKKEKGFQANWAGRDFGPVGRGRAASRPIGPKRPTRSGDGEADAMGAGPRTREGRGDGVRGGGRRAVRSGGEPVAGEPDGGSSPVVRFWVDGVVAKHEWG